MNPSGLQAISREVNDLCRKVRRIAVDLVDAWGIPPEMPRAPDLAGRAEAGSGPSAVHQRGVRTAEGPSSPRSGRGG
ncbi:hypothetical protein ACWCXC_11575 [Streptomyces sp. NPDC001515]